jgi:hypothetical protein
MRALAVAEVVAGLVMAGAVLLMLAVLVIN